MFDKEISKISKKKKQVPIGKYTASKVDQQAKVPKTHKSQKTRANVISLQGTDVETIQETNELEEMIGTVDGRKDQEAALHPSEKTMKEEQETVPERNLDINMKENIGKKRL